MTPVTYEEAAKVLNMRIEALRNAAARGVLTRLPRTGTLQPLVREQVELFAGKKRLSLNVLTTQEKEIWAQYATRAESNAPNVQPSSDARTSAPVEIPGLGVISSLGVLLSLAAILDALSDRPTEEEIDRVVNQIKSADQREYIKRLIADETTRETLKELISAA